MARKKAATVETAEPVLRRCIGSPRYGIEAHEAPVADFPVQPSQRDGLGRMCKPDWNAYTANLARDAKARNAAADGATDAEASAQVAEIAATAEAPAAGKRRRIASTAQGNRYAGTATDA